MPNIAVRTVEMSESSNALSSSAGRRWRHAALAGALVAALALGACGAKKDDSLALDDTPPDQLYNQGLALMAKGAYKDAAKKFEDLDRLYPYSEYARKALVNSAFTYYSIGKYQDAINQAKRFVTLYPGNPDAAYALYIIGQSYYSQISDVTRDQETTARAMDAFDELIRRFPDSEYADDARKKIQIARDQLAGQEMEIGRYYLARHDYTAAINRFRVVVTEYQTTRQVEEALARLTECYYALGVIPEAQTAAAVLGHNFPDSEWYKRAYELLKAGGYSPQENKESWISKAFQSVNQSLSNIKLL